MKTVHLIIPDMFLPQDIAGEVRKGLNLPALEKLLARGVSTGSARAGEVGFLENHLCELFGVKFEADAPIAPIGAAYDGLPEGCWLRADPVHLHLDQSRMLLSAELLSDEDAAAFCDSLNEYFSGQGMEFFSPHPQRWYVRTDALPRIHTTPLSEVLGNDVRGALPTGEEAARWHGILNEIQMLLHAHPVNEAREARGELPVNSVWFWGGGCGTVKMTDNPYSSVFSDDVLPEMFASFAGIQFTPWEKHWCEVGGSQLLVWAGLREAMQRGDLSTWRDALQDFESGYAAPLWQALRAGRIARLQIDVVGVACARQIGLSRGDAWAFWRCAKPLAGYSLV